MRRSAPPRARRDAGFLLTETLATFTISAFILVGLVTASSVLLSAADRNVAHLQDVDALSRTLAAITRDVSGLSRARWNGKEPQPFVFRGGPNSLYFATRDHATGASVVVALREVVAARGPQLTRGEAKLTARMTSFGNLRYAPQHVLDTGPARLRFSYMQALADGGETRRKDWPVGLQLPNALIVEAVDRDTGHVILASRVTIRANADIGCIVGSETGVPQAPVDPTIAAAVGTPNTAQNTPAAAKPADDADAAFCGRPDKDDGSAPPQVASPQAVKPQTTAALTP